MTSKIDEMRSDYAGTALRLSDALPDPIDMFRKWFDEARDSGVEEPNAMTVATATAQGRPSARTLLLKGVDEDGFVFYTNFDSRKSRELAENPHAALLFWWPPLARQVRIEGSVDRVDDAAADAYFQTRPRGSQIGAAASAQSTKLASRDELEARVAELEAEYRGVDVPRPANWGGFRLSPVSFEFWQGQPSRLHDRICYQKSAGGWDIFRLSP